MAAFADQQYDVQGEDVYQIGSSSAPASRVAYSGAQHLSVARDGERTRYDVHATYTRETGGTRQTTDAHFVQELLPDGTFEDAVDDDPDFLTVLNQPFAIHLDPTTLHDLRTLRARVPFNATSPLGGDSVLRGFLRPATGGKVDGHRTVAVGFEADGTMTAPLPAHATAAMAGKMRMEGTAYYSLDDAMLLALDVRLTILAKLRNGSNTEPVRVVYRRFIRASAASSPAKTPRPTAPPSDAGTAPPPTP